MKRHDQPADGRSRLPRETKKKSNRVHRSPAKPQAGRPPVSAPRTASAAASSSPRSRSEQSARRLQAIERRKARSRAVGMAMFVLVIMLVTVLLIIDVMQQARPQPRFIFLSEGQIDEAVRAQGLIIRDETVYTAPASGLLKPLAAEGSRIATGQKLALIIPADREEQLRDLQKIEKDLTELQIELMNSGKGSGARAVYDESHSALAGLAGLIRNDTGRGDLSRLSTYEASIEVLLEQRTGKLAAIDFRDARVTQLQSLRQQLELSLGLESGTLYGQNPGIVSYKLDGLEATLRNEIVLELPPTQVQALLSSEPEMSAAPTQVSAEQPVLRLTSSHHQAFAFILPGAGVSDLAMDRSYDIDLPNDHLTITGCSLLRVEPFADGVFAVFSSDRMVERLSDRRTIQADITLSSTTGLRAPVSALFDLDDNRGEASLMTVLNGKTQTIRVAVIDRDREFAIVEGLTGEPLQPALSTVIVVNPESIGEGEFIGSN